MAKRKTSSSGRSTTRSGSSSAKTSASTRSSKNTQTRQIDPDKEPLWSVIWSYSWGKALYLLLGILVIIGLDFLISMNHYDRFFTVLGIEIIVAMITGWIVYLVLDRQKHKDMTDIDSSDSDFRD